MITEFDMFRSGNGKWVVIIRHHNDEHDYSRGPSIWYEQDCSLADEDPEARLARTIGFSLTRNSL